MSKTTAWLLLSSGAILNILFKDSFYEYPEFIANAAVSVGILGVFGYVNKKK